MPVDRSGFTVGQGDPLAFANTTADFLDLWENALPPAATGNATGKIYVGETDPAAFATNGDVWLDTFRYVFDPNAGSWPAITEVPVSNATNTYTKSIVTPALNLNGTAQTKVARIAWASGTQASDRRVYTFDGVGTLDDIEVTAQIFGRNGAQQGLALRVNNIGNTTLQNMYAIWNDATNGYGTVINIGTWKGIDGSFANTQPAGGFFEGLEDIIDVLTMTRATNVVTATVAHNHNYRSGNIVTVKATVTSSFDGTFTLTSATADTLTWAQTGTNESATVFGTAGVLGVPFGHSLYPHFLKVRVVGKEVRVKVWRSGESEPKYSNPKLAAVWNDSTPTGPTGVGKVGLIDAHHNASGQFSDWGPILVTRAYPRWKVRAAGAWAPISEQSL